MHLGKASRRHRESNGAVERVGLCAGRRREDRAVRRRPRRGLARKLLLPGPRAARREADRRHRSNDRQAQAERDLQTAPPRPRRVGCRRELEHAAAQLRRRPRQRAQPADDLVVALVNRISGHGPSPSPRVSGAPGSGASSTPSG
jgi:hypothetical protein